jgi:hypothetical protein
MWLKSRGDGENGLPSNLLLPRNTAIVDVFRRLHIIENFGAEINRIRDEYHDFRLNQSLRTQEFLFGLFCHVSTMKATPRTYYK